MRNKNKMPREFLEPLLKVNRICRHLGIKYAVIGGIATMVWTRPRATHDIDIVVMLAKDKISDLVRYAETIGFKYDSQENMHLLKSDMFRLRYELRPDYVIPLDFILPGYHYYNSVIRRRQSRKVNNDSLWVAAPEDILLLKLLANRAIDRADAEQIINFLGRELDMNYLKRWAKKFGILKTLKKFYH